MNIYKIYSDKYGKTEVIQEGWSWYAFLFAAIWAFSKGLIGVGIITFYLCILLISAVNLVENGDKLAVIFILAIHVLYGIKGNSWFKAKILKKGFIYRTTDRCNNGLEALEKYRKTKITNDEYEAPLGDLSLAPSECIKPGNGSLLPLASNSENKQVNGKSYYNEIFGERDEKEFLENLIRLESIAQQYYILLSDGILNKGLAGFYKDKDFISATIASFMRKIRKSIIVQSNKYCYEITIITEKMNTLIVNIKYDDFINKGNVINMAMIATKELLTEISALKNNICQKK